MFEINQDDIKTALEQSANNLEYVYAYEDDLLKFSIFIKDFGGFKTVQNVSGLLKEEKEKTIKLIYLNNLMIDYYDGFFIDTILGFENISHLKYVYNFLNNIDKDNKGININNSPIRANKKLSLDVIKPSIKTEVINIEITDNSLSLKDKINPYPRIFKNYIAYNVFTNLLNEFGIIKDNLANYSFIYHRMKKDELIYDDFQQIQFVYFLLEFNINIDRIKRMEDIGKIALRESIYIKAK